MGLSYFLAYFIFPFFLVAGQTPKYVLKGKADHLNPHIPGQPNSILWKHNGNKIVEFDGSEEQVYDPYKNRITLNWITAELEITDLRYEDSGDYELEADIQNKVYTSETKLKVIDTVATPTISCELNEGSSTDGSEVKATLLCSAEPRQPESLMKFEWSSQGKLHPGNKLPISLGDTQIDEEYVCTVSNPVSSETATFRAKDCHENNSSVALGVGLFFLALVLLLALVGTVLFLKWKQKACFANGQQGDVEKQSPAKGSGQKATPKGESRPLLRKSPSRAETFASHQPLGHLSQNHETSPDQLTAGQTGAGEDHQPAGEADVGGVISKGSVKKMARGFDNLAANYGQATPEKSHGNSGEQEPASPLPSPPDKDQGPHGNGDKDDDEGNELNKVQQSDQSNTEEENEPNQAVTSEEKPEDKHPDVESTAERQDSESTKGKHIETEPDQEEDKAKESEAEVQSSELSGSETENQLNPADVKEPVKTVPDPKPTPEQSDSESTKGDHVEAEPSLYQNQSRHTSDSEGDQEEDEAKESEAKVQPSGIPGSTTENKLNSAGGKKPEDTAPDPEPTPEQPESTSPHASDSEGDGGEGQASNSTKEFKPSDLSRSQTENSQNPAGEKKPEEAPPEPTSTPVQPESTSHPASNSEGDRGEGQASNSTKEEIKPSDLSRSQTENSQNPVGEKKPEESPPDPTPTPEQPGLKGSTDEQETTSPVSSPHGKATFVNCQSPHSNIHKGDVKGNEPNKVQHSDHLNTKEQNEPNQAEQKGADQTTAQGDGNSPPPSTPLPDSPEKDGKKNLEHGDTNSDERKNAETESEKNQREGEETTSVPATGKEPHDSQSKPPLTDGSAGLDSKDTDGEQNKEPTAETAATTVNKSNQADPQSKNEPDESIRENSDRVSDAENSDTTQEQNSIGLENDSNIKEN